MAHTPYSSGKQTKPNAPKRDVAPPARPPVAAEPVVEAPVTTLAVSEPAPVAAPAVAGPATETVEITWSLKPLDLWSENAAALLDFAEQVGKAKTVEEVMTLQSRFASDRYESFLRQSKEFMTFAQSFMIVAAPPSGARAT